VFKCLEYSLGGWPGCAPFGAAAIDVGQLDIRALFCQRSFGLIIAEGKQARAKGQQVKETLSVVIPLHVNGRDREEFSLQTTEDILLDILVSISQDALRKGEPFCWRVGGVNAPARFELSVADCFLIADDSQLVAHFTFGAGWLAFVSANVSFFDLAS